MRPRIALVALSGAFIAALLAAPLAAEAQQAGKVYRIGFLAYAGTCPDSPGMVAIREVLRASGYIEGQNMVFECRGGGAPTADQLAGLATELVRLKMDTIVTDGTASAFAAKRATSSIPIVAAYVADPVGSGLVASLARPGGNVTGFSVLSPGIVQAAQPRGHRAW